MDSEFTSFHLSMYKLPMQANPKREEVTTRFTINGTLVLLLSTIFQHGEKNNKRCVSNVQKEC